jgi:heme A synthase
MTVDTDWPPTEMTHRQSWWRWSQRLLGGLLALLVVLTALAWLLVPPRRGAEPAQQQVVRSTFVDSFGRQCTQVTAGNAVALDCDYKPVESRLGSLLEGSQP